MISAPPIVGVPRFEAWAAGPSSRMTSPSCRSRARRMNQGATMKVMVSDVSVARPTRVETYRKTFAPGIRSRNAWNRWNSIGSRLCLLVRAQRGL